MSETQPSVRVWLCWEQGVFVTYPVLHHSDPTGPAQHNERCGMWVQQQGDRRKTTPRPMDGEDQ